MFIFYVSPIDFNSFFFIFIKLLGVYVSDHEIGYNERGVMTLRGEWRSPRFILDHLFCMLQFNRKGPSGLELGYVA